MVSLKLATSLDGKIATRTGESQWIHAGDARGSPFRQGARLSVLAPPPAVRVTLGADVEQAARDLSLWAPPEGHARPPGPEARPQRIGRGSAVVSDMTGR